MKTSTRVLVVCAIPLALGACDDPLEPEAFAPVPCTPGGPLSSVAAAHATPEGMATAVEHASTVLVPSLPNSEASRQLDVTMATLSQQIAGGVEDASCRSVRAARSALAVQSDSASLPVRAALTLVLDLVETSLAAGRPIGARPRFNRQGGR